MAGVSDEPRAAVADVWEAQHRDPFVRGIGDGMLELERFRTWVGQDYLFLADYARVLALGAARARTSRPWPASPTSAQAVLETEMTLHCSYCAEIEVSGRELAREETLPTTQGYTDSWCAPRPRATSPSS